MTTPLLLPPGQPAGQPTAPPPLSPGGRTAVRVGLVALAGVLITAVIVSLAGFAWGASRFRVVADTITLPATLRALTVDTGPVPAVIRITTDRDVSEPRVDLRLISPARTDVEPLTLGADGRSARVSVSAEPAPMLRWARGGEITVVLPPQLARGLAVTTEQDMGVVMADADIDQLTARTTDGAVVLNGSARRIDITNDHGDVASRNAISVAESFRTVTETGDVSVDFAAAPAVIDVETGDGDVVLAVPDPGPYAVNASTGEGRGSTVVSVPQTRNRDDAASVVTARSETGDVVVEALR